MYTYIKCFVINISDTLDVTFYHVQCLALEKDYVSQYYTEISLSAK